jgi:hypothetical protein
MDYTNDLRDLAGQANDATKLTANLTDVQTQGRALDWENVAPHSLSDGHVYDPGTQPLKAADFDFSATVNITADSTWTNLRSHTINNLTVGASWLYVFFGAHIDANTSGAAVTQELRLRLDSTATLRDVEIGEQSLQYGGGYSTFAFQATATSHVLAVEGRVSAGAATTAEYIFLTTLVVHK